jgi:two-component system nitrate/nitrite response regulator NarL
MMLEMAAPDPLRVMVADDHPIYRDGIVQALRLEAGVEVIAVCSRGDEALEAIRTLEPAVAVLDYRMPGADALAVVQQLAGTGSATRVLVLSAFTDGDVVVKTLEAGAAGFLAKESSRESICAAVREIARGGTVIGQEVQAGLAEQIRLGVSGRRPLLSDRETEILALLADGLSAPQIAERLIIGQATVKTHLHNLYEKLGVSDRAAAVAEAMRRGILR